MNKKLWLFVVVVSVSVIGLSGMTEALTDIQSQPSLDGVRSLILFIPVCCFGMFLVMLLMSGSRDRVYGFCQSALILIAAVQGVDIPEVKQYIFQTLDVLSLRKMALLTLPLTALLIPFLFRVQHSHRFFFFKIFLLFSCLAIAIALFSLPDTAILAIHIVCIFLCLCSVAASVVWVALTHKGNQARSPVLISCAILLIFALGDDLILGLAGHRSPIFLSLSMVIMSLVCGRLSVLDKEDEHDAQKLERRHLLSLKTNLEHKMREACSEIALINTRMTNLLDHVPEAVLILDSEARIIRYMARSFHLFGWPSSDVIGRSVVSLISAGWVEPFLRLLRRMGNESCTSWKDVEGFEMDIRNNRGLSVPVFCSVTLVQEEETPYFQVLLRSLEEDRKRQHEANQCKMRLSEVEHTFDLVETHAHTGWYVTSSSEGKSLWSRGLETLWGFNDEHRPKGLRDFIERIIPPDRQHLKQALDDTSWDDNRYTVRVRVEDSEIAATELILVRQRAADGTILRETGIARRLFKQSVVPAGDLVAEEYHQREAGKDGNKAEETTWEAPPVMDNKKVSGENGLNILLVEDVEVNQQVAQMFLKREGHSVTIVDTGEKGVHEASTSTYDLILMDIRLPDIDGVEAAQRIRALPDAVRSRVPIFALTANVFEDDMSRYRDASMNGVIAKPIRMEPFRRALQTVWKCRVHVGKPHEHAVPEGIHDNDSPHLDESFIFDRLSALGQESFIAILELGRRSIETAVSDVRRTLEHQQHNLLGQAGHRLAGAASNFGFVRLIHVGRDIENAVAAGNLQEAAALAHQCPDLWRIALAALETWVQQHNLKNTDTKTPSTVS